MKIRTKFLVPLVAVAVIPLFLVAVITTARFREAHIDQITNLELKIAESAAKEIRSFLSLQFSFLDRADIEFQGFSFVDTDDGLLERILFSADYFLDLSLIDVDGREFDRVNRILFIGPEDLRDRSSSGEYEEIKMTGRYVGPIRLVGGRSVFTIGKAVSDRSGSFSGAILAEVDTRIMQDLVLKISSSEEQGRAYIVDGNGVVVAHPDVSQILAQKNLSSVPIVRSVIELNEPFVSDEIYINELGESVVGAAFPVETGFEDDANISLDRKWYVVAEQPSSVALVVITRMIQFVLFVLAVVVIASVLVSIFLSRYFVRPLEKLIKGARRIGAGSFGTRVEIKTNDELQDLAGAFNDMSENVLKAIEKEKFLEGMKRDFVSVAAHQLRTPLSEIKWSLSLILEEGGAKNLSEKHKKNLQILFAGTERMVALIDDLLNVSRIEEKKFTYEHVRTDFEKLIKEIVKRHDEEIKAKHLSVVVDLPPEHMQEVRIDPEKIGIALENIFDNSVRYTLDGGTIKIVVRIVGSTLRVAVEDSGIGIPKDQQDSIFQKFVRGVNVIRKTREGAAGGSGLGLYIAKNIIEAHGGHIWFESVEDEGSKFYFELPI